MYVINNSWQIEDTTPRLWPLVKLSPEQGLLDVIQRQRHVACVSKIFALWCFLLAQMPGDGGGEALCQFVNCPGQIYHLIIKWWNWPTFYISRHHVRVAVLWPDQTLLIELYCTELTVKYSGGSSPYFHSSSSFNFKDVHGCTFVSMIRFTNSIRI